MNRVDDPSSTAAAPRPAPPSGRPTRRRPRLALGGLLAVGLIGSLVAIAPATASAAPLTRGCASGTYTVARGDGWSIIARKLGVTTRSLLSANGATARTVLHPGRSVCAPSSAKPSPATPAVSAPASGGTRTGGSSGSCSGGTYTVVRGDGWFAIAKKVGVSSTALLAANAATVRTALHPGRSICLPSGATAPVAGGSGSGGSSNGGAAPVARPPAAKNLSAAENEAIVRAAWPDELEDEALRIVQRESGFRNTAKNWCCYGLFQIHWNAHKSWLAGIGITAPEQLLDAATNANAAYVLYQRAGGFGPWKL